jgi:hypothetical protein
MDTSNCSHTNALRACDLNARDLKSDRKYVRGVLPLTLESEELRAIPSRVGKIFSCSGRFTGFRGPLRERLTASERASGVFAKIVFTAAHQLLAGCDRAARNHAGSQREVSFGDPPRRQWKRAARLVSSGVSQQRFRFAGLALLKERFAQRTSDATMTGLPALNFFLRERGGPAAIRPYPEE